MVIRFVVISLSMGQGRIVSCEGMAIIRFIFYTLARKVELLSHIISLIPRGFHFHIEKQINQYRSVLTTDVSRMPEIQE